MRRIRIIHVLDRLTTGGTELVVLKLVAGLDPDLFEHMICALKAGTPPQLPANARYITMASSAAAGKRFFVPAMFRLFARERPDVVHSRNWGAIESIAAARLARVPAVVHSEHGRDIQTMHGLPWRRRVFRRVCFPLANCVFAVTEELRQYYVAQLGKMAERMQVFSNGVDTRRFVPDPAARRRIRDSMGASDSSFLLGCVGRLDPVKDHTTLLRAAELVASRGIDVRVAIVGDGPQRRALEAEASNCPGLRGRAIFPGEIENVPDWVNSFDVFVLPSLSEGMSNTLLEAMSAGVVPVATNVGGNPDLIEDGASGLLFWPRDVGNLANILTELASDPLRRRFLGGNARRRVEKNFSLDKMLDRYTNLYTGLLGMERPKKPELINA